MNIHFQTVKRLITNPEYHSLFFGTFVAGLNLYNIKMKERQDKFSRFQYATTSLMKGVIYGSFYPFSMWCIVATAILGKPEEIKTHFVPLSKYGDPIHHKEKYDQK